MRADGVDLSTPSSAETWHSDRATLGLLMCLCNLPTPAPRGARRVDAEKTHSWKRLCCGALCLNAGNSTQPTDFRDIKDVDSRQAALETVTLLHQSTLPKVNSFCVAWSMDACNFFRTLKMFCNCNCAPVCEDLQTGAQSANRAETVCHHRAR